MTHRGRQSLSSVPSVSLCYLFQGSNVLLRSSEATLSPPPIWRTDMGAMHDLNLSIAKYGIKEKWSEA